MWTRPARRAAHALSRCKLRAAPSRGNATTVAELPLPRLQMLASSPRGNTRNTVSIRAPATSANMGPGFDSFGMAIDVYNELTVTRNNKDSPGYSFVVEGEGKDSIDQVDPEKNMVAQALDYALNALYAEHEEMYGSAVPDGERLCARDLAFRAKNAVPPTRGLGSSSAALVTGIAAAFALSGYDVTNPHVRNAMLQLAATFEGHPDNVAPCIYGGFQVAIHTGKQWITQRVSVPDGLQTVLFVPDFEMPTSEARAILGDTLSRADCVFNISRASMLVNCFATGQLEALRYVCEDRLHQPARSEIFPLDPLIQAALEAGAHGAWLSGAGSTVLAVTGGHGSRVDADTMVTYMAAEVSESMRQAGLEHDISGRMRISQPTQEGVVGWTPRDDDAVVWATLEETSYGSH